jgi:hypothetical protein
MPTWHKLESSERREPQLINYLHKTAGKPGGHFLVIDVGGPSPLWVVPSLYFIRKQTEQATGSKAVTRTFHGSLHRLLCPHSSPVCVLVLTSFDDEQQCGGVKEINPSFPNLLLVMVFHHSNSNPNWDTFIANPISTTLAKRFILHQMRLKINYSGISSPFGTEIS